MVLVVSVMLLAVLVLIGFTAINVTTTNMKISSNYREGTRAFYNAEAGVETVIAYLRTNHVNYATANASPTVINNGTCPPPTADNDTCPPVFPRVSCTCTPISITPPTGFTFSSTVNLYGYDMTKRLYLFRMTGTGANNASRTIEAYIKKVPLYPEGADGAVAMYGGGPQVALKSGANPQDNYSINGQDYPVPANAACNGSACATSPDTTKPALPGLYTVMAPTITGTLSYLNGNPDSTLGPSREIEWDGFVNNVITNNLYQTTLGTRTNPAVTLVPSGTVLAGTYNGAGIIIVDNGGEVKLAGNGCFEGIIILRGTGKVTGVGTNNVYGSIITIGHTSKLISATGVVNMYYSSAALANLSNINSINQAKRAAWRDVF